MAADDDGKIFGQLPVEHVESGRLIELKPAALIVYLVLVACNDSTDEWIVSIGAKRIAQLSGLADASSVRKWGITPLIKAGLIEVVEKGRGRGKTNQYQFVDLKEKQGEIVKDGKYKGHFGQLPNDLTVLNQLAKLNRAAMMAYIALIRHNFHDDGIVWPGMSKLIGLTGLANGHSVRKHGLGPLVKAGLIEKVQEGGGRGQTNRYRIVHKMRASNHSLLNAKEATLDYILLENNGGSRAHQNRVVESLKRVEKSTNMVVWSSPKYKENRKDNNISLDDVVQLMIKLGIHRAVARALHIDSLTEDMLIRHWLAYPKTLTNPQGLLVTDIRNNSITSKTKLNTKQVCKGMRMGLIRRIDDKDLIDYQNAAWGDSCVYIDGTYLAKKRIPEVDFWFTQVGSLEEDISNA
ncbi:hypothetical protein [Poriferisphaera sp. WC338]|uniref:hypothetical protein n=1 Tax=Poriferisphaera sp. WC338 TaxID=3425129 RepID=UPI003D814F84